jgi:hypothetical protein
VPRAFLRDLFHRLVLLLYCLEGGLFLILAPWSPLWPRNYFFRRYRPLGDLALHPVSRGVVSAVGLVLLLQGAWELVRLVLAARRRRLERPAGEAGR